MQKTNMRRIIFLSFKCGNKAKAGSGWDSPIPNPSRKKAKINRNPILLNFFKLVQREGNISYHAFRRFTLTFFYQVNYFHKIKNTFSFYPYIIFSTSIIFIYWYNITSCMLYLIQNIIKWDKWLDNIVENF